MNIAIILTITASILCNPAMAFINSTSEDSLVVLPDSIITEIIAGEEINIKIEILNTGNTTIKGVELEVDGAIAKWIYLSQYFIQSIESSQNVSITVKISVPNTVHSGSYEGVIHLISENDGREDIPVIVKVWWQISIFYIFLILVIMVSIITITQVTKTIHTHK